MVRVEDGAAEMLDHVEADHRLQHVDADLLAAPGAFAVEQRQHDGVGGVHGGDLVGDDGGDVAGLAGGDLLQHGEAGEGLDDVVIGGAAAIGAVFLEAADVTVDQAGVGGGERFVGEADAGGGGGADGVEQHVAGGGETLQRVLAVGRLEVEHDAAFVAVGGEEQRTHAFGAARADGAGDVAFGAFDLDDVGAHVAEGLGGHGAEDHGGEVEHGDAVQGARRRLGHSAAFLGRLSGSMERAMICFMVSTLPPPMRPRRASTKARAIGYSHM